MIRFLIDTNVLSEPFKKTPDSQVTQKLRQNQHEIATATIVWHELWFGCQRLPQSHRREQLTDYLKKLESTDLVLLPYDKQASLWHANERTRLTNIGKPPAFVDSQIAAIAASNDLTLVTRNIKDFERFKGLRLENWFSETKGTDE